MLSLLLRDRRRVDDGPCACRSTNSTLVPNENGTPYRTKFHEASWVHLVVVVLADGGTRSSLELKVAHGDDSRGRPPLHASAHLMEGSSGGQSGGAADHTHTVILAQVATEAAVAAPKWPAELLSGTTSPGFQEALTKNDCRHEKKNEPKAGESFESAQEAGPASESRPQISTTWAPDHQSGVGGGKLAGHLVGGEVFSPLAAAPGYSPTWMAVVVAPPPPRGTTANDDGEQIEVLPATPARHNNERRRLARANI